MSEDQILRRVEAVSRRVFGRENVELRRETTAADVAEWDSLSHMQLIMALEKEFGMRFGLSDIAGLANVGDLVDILAAKASR